MSATRLPSDTAVPGAAAALLRATPILLLVFEGLVLIASCVDLSRGFALLGPSQRIALMVCAGIPPLVAVWPWRPRAGRLRAPLLAIAAGCLALGGLGLLENRGARLIRERWDASARQRLETQARAIEADFGSFLADLSRPLERGRAPFADRRSAFVLAERVRSSSVLPQELLGSSIYRDDGSVVAWDGNSSEAPRTLLARPCPGPVYGIGGREASRRLYAAVCSGDGTRWVAEFVLEPPGEGEPRDAAGAQLSFLPRWRDAGPATVRFRENPSEMDDLAQLFERQGDRHWGRLGGEGALSLAFPLRAPDGGRLAIVNLRDRRATQEIGDRRRHLRLAGGLAAAAAVLFGWCLPLRAGVIRSPIGRVLAGSLALWTIRFILLIMADPSSLPRLAAYDISIYASSGYAGLLRSPADLLLTAAICCAQAWIFGLALRSMRTEEHPGRRRRTRRAALLATVVVACAAGATLRVVLDRLVVDARVDVSRVEPGELLSPRFLLQASLFLLVLGAGFVLLALLELALRHADRPGDWRLLRLLRGAESEGIPFALRSAGLVLLLTIAYGPVLHHSYDRLRRAYFDHELRPLVLDQKQMRRQALREALSLARDPDFAAVAALAAEGSDSAPYRLWHATPVADRGLASSLRVFDSHGALLGRFALDFAPMLEVPFEEARAAVGRGVVELPSRPEMTVHKPAIVGAFWVGGARLPLLVVLTVSDDYDNLPILGGGTLGAGLFRAPAPSRGSPEILRTEPLVAVFTPSLAPLYESGGEIPAPSPETLAAVDKSGRAWRTDDLRGGQAFILYFRGPKEIFALAHLHPSRTTILAGTLRLFLLNGFLALLVAGVARTVAWAARPRLPRLTLGATYSRRLVTVFLIAGLLPLLTLAFFATRSTTREIDRDITTSGLASLQVARHVAEDYLTVTRPEEGGVIDDDVVFWLGRIVRQDINVYRDAELLATSTRELYSSGLLDERMNGQSYRAIYLEREPFFLAEEKSGDLDFLTLAAPMRIDRQGTIGAITIPLIEHSRVAARREGEIEDAVLIVTCFAILLLAIVGNLLARRVSRPVALLSRAARRVATGDLDVRVERSGGDETRVLVDAFNRMAGSLKRQRDDLRRRGDYIEKILRSATTGVVSIDGSGTIITINPAAQGFLTGSLGAPQGGQDLPGHLARDPAVAPLLAALRRALLGQAEGEVEVEMPRPSADPPSGLESAGPRRMRAVFIPFAPEEGRPPGLIVLLEDVTEIVRSGRLAAWAEMARRVAHEIKNPLTPIQLSVEHVRRVFKAKDARFESVLNACLDNIQKQVAVLREIAFEFSTYARLPQLRPEPLAVAALIAEALAPYVKASPAGIVIESDVPADLPLVTVDRAVMVRALINLIENALQAMPSGGRLVVGASVARGRRGDARVAILVTDTGEGIPEHILPRLFEPYFSTKSGGTGLGLGLARRSVEEHGGTIEIRSRPGRGTVVTLTLPASAVAVGPGPAHAPGPRQAGE